MNSPAPMQETLSPHPGQTAEPPTRFREAFHILGVGGRGDKGEGQGWCPNTAVIYGKVLDRVEAGQASRGGSPSPGGEGAGIRGTWPEGRHHLPAPALVPHARLGLRTHGPPIFSKKSKILGSKANPPSSERTSHSKILCLLVPRPCH